MTRTPGGPSAGTFRERSRFPFGAILPALILLLFLSAGGCSRLPKIIVLTDPLTAGEHVDLGVAYERKGELAPARREYEAALRKDGKCFQARVNLGNLSLAEKKYEAARGEYLAALDIRPNDPEATNNLAWAAIYSGKGIEEALTRMEAAASSPGGRRPAVLDTLGVLRMHAGRSAAADEAFALAVEMCAGTVPGSREGAEGVLPCSEAERREIEGHRAELRRSFPTLGPPPVPSK